MKTQTLGVITYGFAGRKWRFKMKMARKGKSYQLITPLSGGREMADRIAKQLNGAAKRGGMDNLARAHVTKIMAGKA